MGNFGQQTLESMRDADWYNDWLLNQFSKYLKGDILEVGCGIGNFTKKLTKYGSVTAIDIEEFYLKETRKKNKEVEVGFGDIEENKLFFKDKKFDSIICINVLEHIEGDKIAIKNLKNLLKKDANLIILVPSHQILFGEIDKAIHHYRRYDKYQLQKYISQIGLEVIKSKKLNFLAAMGWFIAGKILSNKTVQKDKVKLFNLLGPFFLFFEKFYEPPLGISALLIARKKD